MCQFKKQICQGPHKPNSNKMYDKIKNMVALRMCLVNEVISRKRIKSQQTSTRKGIQKIMNMIKSSDKRILNDETKIIKYKIKTKSLSINSQTQQDKNRPA